MVRYFLVFLNIFVFLLVSFTNAVAYKEEAHEIISSKAVQYSNLDFFFTYQLNIPEGLDSPLKLGQKTKDVEGITNPDLLIPIARSTLMASASG